MRDAGYEAIGTSNMKFRIERSALWGQNKSRGGAPKLATRRDYQMAEDAGDENFFRCGLTCGTVAGSRGL